MNRQRGFTLLEIILALVIFASCAMMVVSTIPSRSGADIFGQQLKALVDYGSDRAVMDGNIVGLVITPDNYQLVTLAVKNGQRRWRLKTASVAGCLCLKDVSRPRGISLKRCTCRSPLSVWPPRPMLSRKLSFCRTGRSAVSR
nr:prepilin-type N-terminal cleavage/methylation domain-containing protein [Leclercia adecarboxylata]